MSIIVASIGQCLKGFCAQRLTCLTVAILWWNDVLLRMSSTSFMERKKEHKSVQISIFTVCFVQKLHLNHFDCVSGTFFNSRKVQYPKVMDHFVMYLGCNFCPGSFIVGTVEDYRMVLFNP